MSPACQRMFLTCHKAPMHAVDNVPSAASPRTQGAEPCRLSKTTRSTNAGCANIAVSSRLIWKRSTSACGRALSYFFDLLSSAGQSALKASARTWQRLRQCFRSATCILRISVLGAMRKGDWSGASTISTRLPSFPTRSTWSGLPPARGLPPTYRSAIARSLERSSMATAMGSNGRDRHCSTSRSGGCDPMWP